MLGKRNTYVKPAMCKSHGLKAGANAGAGSSDRPNVLDKSYSTTLVPPGDHPGPHSSDGTCTLHARFFVTYY